MAMAMQEIPKRLNRKAMADLLALALGPRCCPYCGEKERARVTSTHPFERSIRRYVRCEVCGNSWRTDEKISTE